MNNSGYLFDLRVYIEDTDAGGIVYYVNYLKFMERARTEFLRHLGFSKVAILSDEKMLVVHSLSSQYKRPAKLDDLLTVSAEVIKLSRVSITFKQEVFRGSELLCVGEVKIACVDSKSMQPSKLPKTMYTRVQAFINSDTRYNGALPV